MRLVYIAIGWSAGIIVASRGNAPPWLWLILLLISLMAAWLTWDSPRRWLLIALVALTAGGLRYSFVPRASDVAQYNNIGGLTLEGVVIDPPDIRDDRVQLRLNVESVTRAGQTLPSAGIVLVQAPPTSDITYGDRITATGLLITPAEYDTFSYADYLAQGNVFSIMTNAAVEVLSTGHGNPFYAGLLQLKGRAQSAIANALPEPQAALLTGILLGDERGISPELQEAFSRVGASHIIAISGFNMVILSGLVMNLLAKAKVSPRASAVIGITVIALYTLFVGANAAVVRAAIMSSLLVIGPLFKRKTYVPASLAFVAIIISLFNPRVLWDLSFQLSFFATLGMVLFADPLSQQFDRLLHRILPSGTAALTSSFLTEPLIVSIAAQILTLPLIILYFQRLSLISLLVNLLVVPIQSIILIVGGLATLIALTLPNAAQILFWFALVPLAWTTSIIRLFARLPFADIEYSVDARLVALFLMLMIGGAMLRATQPDWAINLAKTLRTRALIFAAVFAAICIFALTGSIILSRPDGNLHVWFLDVGHSNAVLMQTPGGAQMLVDGGRFPSRLLTAVGDRLPFNDREIEVVAVTQPDEFDYSALSAVLARYDVGVVLYHGQPNLSEPFATLQQAFSNHEQVQVRAGYRLDMDDGTRLEILHPQTQPALENRLDDQAMVIRLSYGDISFLLTGDVSAEGQNALLEAGQWPLATVMQLPKHGAIRSLNEDFLQAVQPQAVALQSDRANRLGDPDPDTLNLLGDTPLFRTDQSGTIHFWTNGADVWVSQEN
jgi:competence protein ComEC